MGNLQIRAPTLCQGQGPVNKAHGTERQHPSCRKQMPGEAKRLVQGHRGNRVQELPMRAWFRSSSRRPPLESLVILGFEEFNRRRLPHRAFSFHVKTSSENIPSSSRVALPPRVCEEKRPRHNQLEHPRDCPCRRCI